MFYNGEAFSFRNTLTHTYTNYLTKYISTYTPAANVFLPYKTPASIKVYANLSKKTF